MFHKVLATFGAGGATVDAVLLDHAVRPGGVLRGEVTLIGGQVDQEVESLAVSLIARVTDSDLSFETVQIGGRDTIRAGQKATVPFQLQLPWETPITAVSGQQLGGMAIGLQTNVQIANTVVDPQDVDSVAVEPLPAQQRLLDALTNLGCTFSSAALRKSKISGVDQQQPFFQEISFTPPPPLAQAFHDITVTFLPRPQDLQVVLDIARKTRVSKTATGLGNSGGQPNIGAFPVAYDDLGRNWEQQLQGWFGEVARPRAIFG